MEILKEGQIINNLYTVEKFLGEGAFAEVYRVNHRILGRQALKIFKIPISPEQDIEDQLSEAIILSKIGHPNIIRVFDANICNIPEGEFGFFTMEYIAGGNLEQFWKSFGLRLISIEKSIEIVIQASRGISLAHNEDPPIIHRDIKPQNILLGYEGEGIRVRVSDFGLAKRVNPLTLLASAKGTMNFKAPETFETLHSDSCAGDVWALGCTLYLLLTDRLPFNETTRMGRYKYPVFDGPLIPTSEFNISVNEELNRIVSKSLSIEADNRYQNANELHNALEELRTNVKQANIKEGTLKSVTSKNALGASPIHNKKQATKMIDSALILSHKTGKLMEAADILEQAFNLWPPLREQYESKIKLWRRGIVN
jgi:serine/threonine protein kinase